MSEDDVELWIARYQRLNGLGKAMLIAETGVRTASKLIDLAVQRAADVVVHAEKAFRQGMDPNIEEAKILEEHVRSPKQDT